MKISEKVEEKGLHLEIEIISRDLQEVWISMKEVATEVTEVALEVVEEVLASNKNQEEVEVWIPFNSEEEENSGGADLTQEEEV